MGDALRAGADSSIEALRAAREKGGRLSGEARGEELQTVAIEDFGRVRVVTLNRPRSLNAASRQLGMDVTASLRAAEADEDVIAVVVTGAGRAFCAGADLQEASRLTPDGVEAWYGPIAGCYRQIMLLEKPVVAAVNGAAAGAGYQIAIVSDWRVGSPATRMAQPEINAGLPSIMGSYLMTLHLPWSLNQELSYGGRAMDAQECRRVGLLNDLVEPEELLARARARATELGGKAPTAFRATKARFRDLALRGFDDAYAAAVRGMQASFASGEPQAIMAQFLAQRSRRKREGGEPA